MGFWPASQKPFGGCNDHECRVLLIDVRRCTVLLDGDFIGIFHHRITNWFVVVDSSWRPLPDFCKREACLDDFVLGLDGQSRLL
jgi:hypothetical protein